MDRLPYERAANGQIYLMRGSSHGQIYLYEREPAIDRLTLERESQPWTDYLMRESERSAMRQMDRFT